jgi:transposase
LRAKSHRVDAQLIARFLANEHAKLHPFVPPTPEQRQLDRLLKRPAKLRAIRAALIQSLNALGGFAVELKAPVFRLDVLVQRIDSKIHSLIAASAQGPEHYARLRGIPSVGPVVGSGVLNSLQRLPFASADAYVAFCGLDPRADDSGRKRGPSAMPRLLYNAAMSASRTKAWRPLYERILAKGLSHTEALVILARRIARTAWSIYTHKAAFNAQRISSVST